MHIIFFQIPDIIDIHKKHPPNRKTKRGRAEVGGNSAYEGKQFRRPGCPAWRGPGWDPEASRNGFSCGSGPYVFLTNPRVCLPRMLQKFFLGGDDFVINPVFLGGFTENFMNDLVIGTMTVLPLWVNAGASAIEFPGTSAGVSFSFIFVSCHRFGFRWFGPPTIFVGEAGGFHSPGEKHSTNV